MTSKTVKDRYVPFAGRWEYALNKEIRGGASMVSHIFRLKGDIPNDMPIRITKGIFPLEGFKPNVMTMEKGHFHGMRPFAKVMCTTKDEFLKRSASYAQYGTQFRVIGTYHSVHVLVQINTFPTHVTIHANAHEDRVDIKKLFKELLTGMEDGL